MKTTTELRLEDACRQFSKALQAVESGHIGIDRISNKGKTLLSVNRTKTNRSTIVLRIAQ